MSDTILTQKTIRQFEFSDAIRTALEERRGRLEGTLSEHLGTKKAAQQAIGYVDALVEKMSEAREGYREALSKVDQEQGDDDEKRREVVRTQRALEETARAVRDRLRAYFGRELAASRYLVGEPPPQNRQSLRGWAERAIDALSRHEDEITDDFGTTFRTAPLHEALVRDRDAFVAATGALGQDERVTQDARTTRDGAEDQFVRALRASGQTLQAMFRLCEMDGAAARVYPSSARLRGEPTASNSEPDAPADDADN